MVIVTNSASWMLSWTWTICGRCLLQSVSPFGVWHERLSIITGGWNLAHGRLTVFGVGIDCKAGTGHWSAWTMRPDREFAALVVHHDSSLNNSEKSKS